MKTRAFAPAVLIIGLSVIGTTRAGNETHNMFYSASSSCQGETSSVEAGLRKRPLAIVNIGTTTAVVTCGVTTHKESIPGLVGDVENVTIFLRNTSGIVRQISCTLSNDQNIESELGGVAIAKTGLINGNELKAITWTKAENLSGAPFRLPGISCALPPGVQIEQIKTQFFLNAGP